ncbi:MAG: response regulator, partial [Chloroflexi bacterium]|nr:response regulator [Chloroflexota bacterium]
MEPAIILIVDDEDVIRKALQRTLSGEGYRCHEASNAEQALEELKRNPVALVILDIKMPGRSGLELLPEIKASYPDTAVIMATATIDTSIAVKAMKLGAHDYITKPFSLDEVVLSVQAALRKRELELANKDFQRQTEGRGVEPVKTAGGRAQADRLLKLTVDKSASDLHLRASRPPILRIDGVLVRQDLPPVSAEEIEEILASITKPEQKDTFRKDMELDFVYVAPGIGRFRVNALWQTGTISLAFRTVPFEVLSIDKLGLPQICKALVLK